MAAATDPETNARTALAAELMRRGLDRIHDLLASERVLDAQRYVTALIGRADHMMVWPPPARGEAARTEDLHPRQEER
jgi:hypothetical protein